MKYLPIRKKVPPRRGGTAERSTRCGSTEGNGRTAPCGVTARCGRTARCAASVTVYLALSMSVLLSLLFALIEGARQNAVRMQVEIVGDIASQSVLAEFHRELFKQYDLLFVDMSYGSDIPSESAVTQHIRRYMAENYGRKAGFTFRDVRSFTALYPESAVLTGTHCAADKGGEAVREQVAAYMSAEPLGALITSALQVLDVFDGFRFLGGGWEERRDATEEAKNAGLYEAAERKRAEKEERRRAAEAAGEVFEEEEEEEDDPAALDPTKPVEEFRMQPLLTQVFGGTDGLSDKETDTSKLLTHREYHTGTGLSVRNTHGYARADSVLFNEYLLEKCGYYTKKREGTPLAYEIEYILFGEASDRENLEKTAAALLGIRFASNCAYLFSDTGKISQAEFMAAAVSLVLFMPELLEPLKYAILFAWSYVESIRDLRRIFNGGRVPLAKDASSWQTSLAGILVPSAGGSGKGEGSGLDYRDYLRILLWLESGEARTFRFMDIAEMNIRKTDGNARFRMDWCMDAFSMETVTSGAFGQTVRYTRAVSYN